MEKMHRVLFLAAIAGMSPGCQFSTDGTLQSAFNSFVSSASQIDSTVAEPRICPAVIANVSFGNDVAVVKIRSSVSAIAGKKMQFLANFFWVSAIGVTVSKLGGYVRPT